MKTELSPSEQDTEPQEAQKPKLISVSKREKLHGYI